MPRRRILVMRSRIGGIGITIEKTRRGQNMIQASMIGIKKILPNIGIRLKKHKRKKNETNPNQTQRYIRRCGSRLT